MKFLMQLLLFALLPTLASCGNPLNRGPQASPPALASTPTAKATGAIKAIPCSSLSDVPLSHVDTTGTKAWGIAYNSVFDAVCGPQK